MISAYTKCLKHLAASECVTVALHVGIFAVSGGLVDRLPRTQLRTAGKTQVERLTFDSSSKRRIRVNKVVVALDNLEVAAVNEAVVVATVFIVRANVHLGAGVTVARTAVGRTLSEGSGAALDSALCAPALVVTSRGPVKDAEITDLEHVTLVKETVANFCRSGGEVLRNGRLELTVLVEICLEIIIKWG